jgi:hypothetical protein
MTARVEKLNTDANRNPVFLAGAAGVFQETLMAFVKGAAGNLTKKNS